jgi:hypothetical protein
MDPFSLVVGSIYNILIVLVPLTVIFFIVYKIVNPYKERLIEERELSWLRAAFLINFVISFVLIFIIYMYFYFIGIIGSGIVDVELTPTLFEHVSFILFDAVRIVISSIIISLTAIVFEFIAGFAVDIQEEKEYSKTIKEIIGIMISLLVFLVLFLFIFNFAFLGMFIYIFFGGVSSPPLIMVLV